MSIITLNKSEMPKCWYNALKDLPDPLAPPLSAASRQPATVRELSAIFPESLLEQEMSAEERFYPIPEEVLQAYALWRPTPLVRARELEKALGVKSRLYYKNESVSPSGSHKQNSAVPQAYFNKMAGIKNLTTETGAGQWGTALSMACHTFNLGLQVYMVRVSYKQKPQRRTIMNLMGATVIPSPSPYTQAGRSFLAQAPDTPGTLGQAISEAVEVALANHDTNYSLGSVLNHVLLHQTVIGQEAIKQMALAGEKPDYLVACHGGGSNFGGLVLPFLPEILEGHGPQAIAIEPESCPTLTQGRLDYDYGDTSKLTPLLRMYSLGHEFTPPAIHAGGLRYHGASPIVSQLLEKGLISARTVGQVDLFKYAHMFAKSEALIPAPESGHAIAGACLKALELEKEGRPGAILFGLSGHGHYDLTAYDHYLESCPEARPKVMDEESSADQLEARASA